MKEFTDQRKEVLESQGTNFADSRVSGHTSRVYDKSSKWHDMIAGTNMGEKDPKKYDFNHTVITIAGQSPRQIFQPVRENSPMELRDAYNCNDINIREKSPIVGGTSESYRYPSPNFGPIVGNGNGNLNSEEKLTQCVDLVLTLQRELGVERDQRLKLEKRLFAIEQGGDLGMSDDRDAVPNMPIESGFVPGDMHHSVMPEVIPEKEKSNFEVGSDTGQPTNTSEEIKIMKLQILDLQSKLLHADISNETPLPQPDSSNIF